MSMAMWNAEALALVAAAFLVAGLVKGLVGMGLPTVALAILAATIDIKTGMALIVVPALVTNIWQALVGGALRRLAARLWPMLAAICIGIWAGAAVLARTDAGLLSAVLGGLLVLYAAVSLFTPQIPPPGRHEIWLSPMVGATAGVMTGLTGSFVMPGAIYLQALNMPRDVLIQALGMTFVVCTVAMAAALGRHGLLTLDLGALSVAALAPAFVGMVAGQRIRQRLPEASFRRVFFCALLALGVYLVARWLAT